MIYEFERVDDKVSCEVENICAFDKISLDQEYLGLDRFIIITNI